MSLAWLVGCALLTVAPGARANQAIAVHATRAASEPLVGRLCAELASAGYAVSLELSDPAPACERGKGAWVSLAPDPARHQVLVATICFEGTEVAVAGAVSEPARLAIAAAEALNGLRAKTPPEPDPRPRRPAPARVEASKPPSRRHSLSVGQSLVVDPQGFPPLWGASLDVALSLGSHTGVALGGFFPIARAQTSIPSAELRTGIALLRVGPALRYSLPPFALEGSLLVGPAYTWVTAKAALPYAGKTDAALGVLGSAGLAIAYPDRSPVFAMAGSRVSTLLPSPRIQLPNQPPRDFGPLLLEASLSFGLRL